MNTKTVLFGERAAGVYRMSEIYFPSQYTEETTPEASGKIVPAVESLVVDDTTGLHNQQYTVTAVDPITYEPTLIPSTFVIDSTAQIDRVLSYGNDIFMLYFSTVTKNVNGSNINLTRLIVDNKLSLFGRHAAIYQLVQTDDDGKEKIISRKYNVNGSNLVPAGTFIPMLDTGVEGIRKCDGCYTDASLTEGEEIRCDIYTAGGILIAQIRLIAKKAHLLNETFDTANPIVSMTIEGSQMDRNSGVLYLFQGQNVKELAIYVNLNYADGSYKTVAIDNRRGFCYGLETVTSEIVGSEFEFLVKYYLSASDATGTVLTNSDEYTEDTITRFISKKATIKIISGAKDLISKVSPIPEWNSSENKWVLKFLRYHDSRFVSPYHSDSDSNINHVEIVSAFDGSLFNQPQLVTISYKEVINNLGEIEMKRQSFIIELRNHNNENTDDNNVTSYWLIKDDDNSPTYGDDSGAHIVPKIKYTNGTGYFIYGISESSSLTATEVFIENFYTNANPPKRVDETIAPMPTHFRVKLSDGTALTPDAIPVDNFAQNLNIITGSNSANFLLNRTVVVEFLKQIDSVTCEYLYGVPVYVC